MGGQCLTPAALPKTWYLLYRMGGPQGRFGWVWKISPPGFNPWTIIIIIIIISGSSRISSSSTSICLCDLCLTQQCHTTSRIYHHYYVCASFILERSNVGRLFRSQFFILYFNIFSYFYLLSLLLLL